MAKTIWVVRIHRQGITVPISPSFLECLRYAGIAKPNAINFDLYPPMGTGDTKVWAEQNAERMKTYRYEASVVKAGTPV